MRNSKKLLDSIVITKEKLKEITRKAHQEGAVWAIEEQRQWLILRNTLSNEVLKPGINMAIKELEEREIALRKTLGI